MLSTLTQFFHSSQAMLLDESLSKKSLDKVYNTTAKSASIRYLDAITGYGLTVAIGGEGGSSACF